MRLDGYHPPKDRSYLRRSRTCWSDFLDSRRRPPRGAWRFLYGWRRDATNDFTTDIFRLVLHVDLEESNSIQNAPPPPRSACLGYLAVGSLDDDDLGHLRRRRIC